jgi:hypothetical protein
LGIAPLTLTLPLALKAYLFVAHTLEAPDQALEAALLAGSITAPVGLFCVGLVSGVYIQLILLPLDRCPDPGAGNKRRCEVTRDRRLAGVFELVRFWTSIIFTFVWLTITPLTVRIQDAPSAAATAVSRRPE